MKTLLTPFALGACALLLTACGGEDQVQPGVAALQVASTTVHKASRQAVVASDYHEVVQRVYVAYFGRPADDSGLAFFANNYLNAGAATNIVDASAAYGSNAAVTALIDAFGTSAESSALYPGTNVEFITAIYSNLFNRAPDQGGLDFWVGNLNSGAMTRAQAAVAIMAGSQTTDAALIAKKTAVALAFTQSLNTEAKRLAYSGLAANAVVRTMLGSVTLDTDVTAFQTNIDATITSLLPKQDSQLFTQVQAIVKNRCAACHSAKPTFPGYNPAPKGIIYDTPQDITDDRVRIAFQVKSGGMPLGNFTAMTTAERAVVAEWFASTQ